jgi:sirohydrochlorin ferrochelatase
MKVALIDNGSLEPRSHEGLRAAAAAIGESAGTRVEAVSWKHSNRIPAGDLRGGPAWTLAPWIRRHVLEGEREFVFVPFFICPQGAIGSSLGLDLGRLRDETGGFSHSFTDGVADAGVLPAIVAGRVREAAAARGLRRPAVVVVDHGGPAHASADLRDSVASAVRDGLGQEIGPLAAASMESPDGPDFEFNRPLLAEALGSRGFDAGDVVVAPLFLLPGRHAGPGGDLEAIARAAEGRSPRLRCHFAGLVGSHPAAIEALAGALSRSLGAGVPT